MNIEELITNNRAALDTEVPQVAVWHNIKKSNQAPIAKINRKWLAIAAAIVVLATFTTVLSIITKKPVDATNPNEIVIQRNDTNCKSGIDSTPQINGKDTQGLKQLSVNDTNETTKCLQIKTSETSDLALHFSLEKESFSQLAFLQTKQIWNNLYYHMFYKRNKTYLPPVKKQDIILSIDTYGVAQENNC